MALGVSQLGRLGRLGLGSDQLGDAGAEGPSFPPDAYFYADLLANTVRLNGVDYTGLANVAGYSFARASQAYALNSAGELLSFASGAPRITNKGLLIEGAAQNLLTYSQDFRDTTDAGAARPWSYLRVTISSNAALAPDGTMTATKITETTATNSHALQAAFTFTAAAHTLSVYLKAAERSFALIGMEATTNVISVNLSTGAASSANGSPSNITSTALANGWYRVSFTATTAAGSNTILIYSSTDGVFANRSYAGDDTKGILAWGAQLEATAYATSYIPTTSGAVTRAADVLSIGSISNLAFPLTLFAEFERAVDTGAQVTVLRIDDGSSNNISQLYVSSADLAGVFANSGGATQAQITVAGALAVGTTYKQAARISSNSVQICRSGTLGTEDTSATVPAAPSRFLIGSTGSGEFFSGYLKRLGVYPSAYADAALQVLAP